MNRINRNRHLIASALAQRILNRDSDGNYIVNPDIYDAERNPANRFDMDFIKKHIDKLKKTSEIQYIPRQKGINMLTYFNRPAQPIPN